MKIIAECAKEHDGNMTVAMAMIYRAKLAGCDAVKFQAYDIKDLVRDHSNFDRYVDCYSELEKLKRLKEYADKCDIKFYVSCFTKSMLKDLSSFTDTIKVASTYFSHSPFIDCCMEHFNEVHISTGMHDIKTVDSLIKKYNKQFKKKNIIFYHTTSMYPTPDNMLRLHRIKDMGLAGFSYHGKNMDAILYAKILGAKYLELHFSTSQEYKEHTWTDQDIKFLRKYIREKESMFTDSELSEEELNNFSFYKGEYKTLCSK